MVHTFVCDKCNVVVEDTNTKKIHYCPKCEDPMRWNLHINRGSRGDYNFVSESLAISPSQINEHRERFPDVNVLSDGRIEFDSFRKHDDYLDKTGFCKCTQKKKKKITL